MEEAQTRDPGGLLLRVAASSGSAQAAATPRFTLSYARHAAVESVLAQSRGLLGVVAFGPHPTVSPGACPFLWVDMPVLHGGDFCELWQTDEPVEFVEAHGIRGARSSHLLFGALQIDEDDGLEHAARTAYDRVFAALDTLGFPHLLRTWNYFPEINTDADGVERYLRFNTGRHDAFAARGRTAGADMPAACALGCRSGPLTVYFIAGTEPGLPVENPRQVSAYRYPARYGPRTPVFSRAMLMQRGQNAALAISGTASIVGHETQHVGDPAAQIDETLTNIDALVQAAGYSASASAAAGSGLLLKAYLRRERDLPIVEAALARAYPEAEVVYLKADICRAELLVEVEGLYCP